jgi:hypothetical protein
MNATRPEAESEYSRADRASEADLGGRKRGSSGPPHAVPGALWLVLAGGLIGAALLLAAEFTTLFTIHSSAYGAPVRTEGTGAHQSYALVPVALLAAVLTIVAVRSGSRAALLGIGAMGLVALGIALLGDLPDAQATGFVGSSAANLATASSSPSTGLYLETLGAIVLLITAGAALLLAPAPRGRQARTPTRHRRAVSSD